jgi:hypothetical protein
MNDDTLRDIVAKALLEAARDAYYEASTEGYDEFLATSESYYEEADTIIKALRDRLLAARPAKSLALRKMYKTEKEYFTNLGYNAGIDACTAVIASVLNDKEQ